MSITYLQPTGTPGRKQTFLPKGVSAGHTGDFTRLSPSATPGRRYSFTAKSPSVPVGHTGEFTWQSPTGLPGKRYSFEAKTPGEVPVVPPRVYQVGGTAGGYIWDEPGKKPSILYNDDEEILTMLAMVLPNLIN